MFFIYLKKYYKKDLSFFKIGALTNKPYKFRQRVWELNNFFSLDFTNSFLESIIYSYNLKNFYLKVQSLNKWITNSVRYGAEGLKFKRKEKKSLFFKRIKKFSLYFLFLYFCKKLFKWDYIFNVFLNGGFNIENLILIKMFFKKLGNTFFNFRVFGDYSFNNFINNDSITLYTLRLNFNKFNEMDCLVLLGINPRLENPLLNLELRKIYRKKKNNKLIYSFSNIYNTTYKINILGIDLRSFYKFIEGRHKFCIKFYNSERPLILIGSSLLNLKMSEKIIFNLENIYYYVSLLRFNKEKEIIWNGINILNYNNLDIVSRDLGIQNKVNLKKYKNIMYFLFNYNIFNKKQLKLLYNRKNLKEKKFKPIIIYFGSYYNIVLKNLLVLNFNIVDIIEGVGTYLTYEGMTKLNKGFDLKNHRNNEYVYTDENNKIVYLFVCFFKLFFKYSFLKSDLTELYYRYSGFLDLNIKNLRKNSYVRKLCTYMVVYEFFYHIFLFKKQVHYIKNSILNEYKFNEIYVKKFKHGLTEIHRHSSILIKSIYIFGKENIKFKISN